MTTSIHPAATDFPLVRRGYDPETVDRFISDLRHSLLLELEQAKADIGVMRKELDEARRREEAIHLTLVAATQTKDQMLEAADRAVAEARALAKETGDRIVSEAQYEAFRIVTEAREEAEQALADARREVELVRSEGATFAAANTVEVRQRKAELETEESELRSRLERMGAVTAELEQRLRLLVHGALDELGSVDRAIRAESNALADIAGAVAPERTSAGAPHLERDRPDADAAREETSPSQHAEDDEVPAVRGSYYSRRSARLPRIGDGANDALAAMSAMRVGRGEMTEEDMAMKTA